MYNNNDLINHQQAQQKRQEPIKPKYIRPQMIGSPQTLGRKMTQFSLPQRIINRHMNMRRSLNQSVDYKLMQSNYPLGAAGSFGINSDIITQEQINQNQDLDQETAAGGPLQKPQQHIQNSQGTTQPLSENNHLENLDSIGTFQSIDSKALKSKLRVMKQFRPELPGLGANARQQLRSTANFDDNKIPSQPITSTNFLKRNLEKSRGSWLGADKKMMPPAATMTHKKAEKKNWRRDFYVRVKKDKGSKNREGSRNERKEVTISYDTEQQYPTSAALSGLLTEKNFRSVDFGSPQPKSRPPGVIPIDFEYQRMQQIASTKTPNLHWTADLKNRLKQSMQQKPNQGQFVRASVKFKPKTQEPTRSGANSVVVSPTTSGQDGPVSWSNAGWDQGPPDEERTLEEIDSHDYVCDLIQRAKESARKLEQVTIPIPELVNKNSSQNSSQVPMPTEKTNTASIAKGVKQSVKTAEISNSRSVDKSYDDVVINRSALHEGSKKTPNTSFGQDDPNRDTIYQQYEKPKQVVEGWDDKESSQAAVQTDQDAEGNRDTVYQQYEKPKKIIEDWNDKDSLACPTATRIDMQLEEKRAPSQKILSGSHQMDKTAPLKPDGSSFLNRLENQESNHTHDQEVSEIMKPQLNRVSNLPNDQSWEPQIMNAQKDNIEKDPASNAAYQQNQPYALNINYIQNQYNNYPPNNQAQNLDLNEQIYGPAWPPQQFGNMMTPDEYQNYLRWQEEQVYLQQQNMQNVAQMGNQNVPQYQQQFQTNQIQGSLPLNRKYRQMKNNMSMDLSQSMNHNMFLDQTAGTIDTSAQIELASNQVPGGSRPGSYIRGSKNMMRSNSKFKTPYNTVFNSSMIDPSPPKVNKDLAGDVGYSNIDRIIQHYQGGQKAKGSQVQYNVVPSKLMKDPFRRRAEDLRESPDPKDIIEMAQQEVDSEPLGQKYLYKHVVSQRGQNFYFKISKAQFLKEQKPKIKVVKLQAPRPKTPPAKVVVVKPRTEPIKVKDPPPPPPPKRRPTIKKPKTPVKKVQMKNRQMQTDAELPEGRSVCSTERIINIQTIKMKRHIQHASNDIAKEHTRSIFKQASHFITENGEAADIHMAHMEDVFNDDDPRAGLPKYRHRSSQDSALISGGPGGLIKPMTAFMDYKDYRIDYEGKRASSDFDSSKDYSQKSNQNSLYEKRRINREIRVDNRETAQKNAVGLKNRTLNSERRVEVKTEGAKEVKEAKASQDQQLFRQPSSLDSPYRLPMKKLKKNNVKIKSFIADARNTFMNQSRDFSKYNEVSADYGAQPKMQPSQFKIFDRGIKKGAKEARQRNHYGTFQTQTPVIMTEPGTRIRSAKLTSRNLVKQESGGILQNKSLFLRSQRISDLGSHKQGETMDEMEAKRSVTFDLSQPPQSPKSHKSVGKNLIKSKPKIRKLKSQMIPKNDIIQNQQITLDSLHTLNDDINEHDEKEDNKTQDATMAMKSNDLWRRYPDLELIQMEYEAIANKEIKNKDVTRKLVDWFHTNLYRHIFETNSVDLELDPEESIFYSSSEVMQTLQELILQHTRQEDALKSKSAKRSSLGSKTSSKADEPLVQSTKSRKIKSQEKTKEEKQEHNESINYGNEEKQESNENQKVQEEDKVEQVEPKLANNLSEDRLKIDPAPIEVQKQTQRTEVEKLPVTELEKRESQGITTKEAAFSPKIVVLSENQEFEIDSYKDLLARSFARAINTIRRILVHELDLPRTYERYLVLHADDINYVNTTRLLVRCKKLLEGRKLLAQILAIIIERNKLINSLKQMIALDDAAQAHVDRVKEQEEWGISNIVQSSYGADLGMFKFDEDLAKDLGTTIVKYSVVVQRLIKDLIEDEYLNFPGLSTNNTRDCVGDLFVFKGTDFIKYVRKETNEIKHLLFVYRIEV